MRADKLMELLAENGIRAALLSKEENIRYFTGYTGEGDLLLLPGRKIILTDFRYVEQVAKQAPDAECIRTRGGVRPEAEVARILKENGLDTLAYEPYKMTVEEYNVWHNEMPDVKMVSLENKPEYLRRIKDAGEIQSICKAAEIACAAFDDLLGWVKPGMTEKQVQADLDYAMLKRGSEANAFSTIACAGLNGSMPHAVPGQHVIEKGELLTLDFGAKVNGYCCDMTRTIAIGSISDELRAIYDAVLEAQLRALAVVKPGACCRDIDAVARDYLEALYPGAFGHSLGHGVGLFIHEGPGLSTRDTTILVPGHVVTVEPGVYIPGLGGCRIEDMALITEDGYIDPITAPKQLIQID